jgi:predicted Zn-dependent protease
MTTRERPDGRVETTMKTMNVGTWRKAIPALAVALLSVGLVDAQTVITPSKNNYTPAEDVELGRQAAAEVDQQLPMLRDDAVTSFVAAIGRRLVVVIPPEFRHAELRYSFQVVNVREINAFALPGGPMYVNRGMIERARTEGEVAGVMAHELSHVVLRHGTAQATKATKYELGTLAGAVLGAIIGGPGASWHSTQFASARAVPVKPRVDMRRTCSARRSWRTPATIRATWRTCSRRSSRRTATACRSG